MGAILDLPEIRERVHRWTVEEYEKLGDDPAFRRSELIRGIIVEKMSKSPLHSTLATKIYLLIVGLLPLGFIARKEEPLRLVDSVPEPDISVLRGTFEAFNVQHPTTAALVIEVAISSVAPDRANASLYAEAEVQEYWIVLGASEMIEVYRRPENGVYQQVQTYRRGELVEVVGGQSLMVDSCFDA